MRLRRDRARTVVWARAARTARRELAGPSIAIRVALAFVAHGTPGRPGRDGAPAGPPAPRRLPPRVAVTLPSRSSAPARPRGGSPVRRRIVAPPAAAAPGQEPVPLRLHTARRRQERDVPAPQRGRRERPLPRPARRTPSPARPATEAPSSASGQVTWPVAEAPARPGWDPPAAPASAPPIDIEGVTERVVAAIDRRIVAHRERLGRL